MQPVPFTQSDRKCVPLQRYKTKTLFKGYIVRKTFMNKVDKKLDYGFSYWAASNAASNDSKNFNAHFAN